MRSNNPLVIPRNHKVEEVLEAANNDDLNPLKNLLKILEKPYEDKKKLRNINRLLRQAIRYIKLFVVLNLQNVRFCSFFLRKNSI